jgi:hypothetical protein
MKSKKPKGILFHNSKRKIKDVKEFKYNPRKISSRAKQNLLESLEKFHEAEVPVINTDNTIIAGHQRIKILAELYGEDHEFDCRIPERKLNKEEAKEYNLRSNKNTGEFDKDILSDHWEEKDLLRAGWTKTEIESLRGLSKNYTPKIESPVYKPQTKRAPRLSALYDDSKAIKLAEKINSADIPEDVQHFLIIATKRHIIFNYDKIAEYYSHASKEIQELFEDSALVIIDFNKAIENGYVKLSKDIKEQYLKDYE